MSPFLERTLARYSTFEATPDEPSAEHYAAARRWLACAREARDWALHASPGTESVFWSQACDALLHADEHRTLARRWRPARGTGTETGPRAPEAFRREARAAEEVRRALAIDAYYAAARKAVRMARAFACEPGTTGRRERECLDQVVRWRRAIAALRLEQRLSLEGPGLRKAGALGLPGERTSILARERAS